MSFNWSEYYDLAKTLADLNAVIRASDTARQRAAISRAYYAAFCSARNYLRGKCAQPFHDSNAHEDVKNEFIRIGDRLARDVAKNLNRARQARNEADYEDGYDAAANVDAVLRWVEQSLACLRKMP